MKNKKYEIMTDITIEYKGRTLYTIRATRDFNDVKAGDLGGWVQSESNLSQEGNCWIYDSAIAMDNSRVEDNAEMHGNAKMWDSSQMHDNTKMYDYTKMWGNSCMYDNSRMYDSSQLKDDSELRWEGAIGNNAILKNNQKLYGKLYTTPDDFIDINNPKGRMVTCILKEGKILYNIGCQEEITKEVFINRIYNEDGGLEKNPHREYYLAIIEASEAYFKNLNKKNIKKERLIMKKNI